MGMKIYNLLIFLDFFNKNKNKNKKWIIRVTMYHTHKDLKNILIQDWSYTMPKVN